MSREHYTGSDPGIWLSSWDTKTKKKGHWPQGEHSLNQDTHPNDQWKMMSSRKDVHMKGYGMGKEELVPCGKENQGRGPCVDKLVLNSL